CAVTPGSRQVLPVLSPGAHVRGLRWLARPQHAVTSAVTREDRREGRPPRAGAEDRDGHRESARGGGGTGERVAREPSAGRVKLAREPAVGSGPAGERAAPSTGQDPRRGQLAAEITGCRPAGRRPGARG